MFPKFKALSIAVSVGLAAVGAIAIHPTAAQAQIANLSDSELLYLADFDRSVQLLSGTSASVFSDPEVAIGAVNMGYGACDALKTMTIEQFMSNANRIVASQQYSSVSEMRMFAAVRIASLGAGVRNLCTEHAQEYSDLYGAADRGRSY